MDFDDDGEQRRGCSAADPLPPDDWAGFGRAARVEVIYLTHRPQLARLFKGRAHPQDVGDLVHDVFRRFLSARGAAPDLVRHPGAYLAAMASNLLVDSARRDQVRMATRHVRLADNDHVSEDPHEALEARDEIRRVESAISRLKPRTREIFLLHRFDGLSYEQIATEMGMSVKGVEKQIAKALVAVRRARSGRP